MIHRSRRTSSRGRDVPVDFIYDNTILADNFDSIKGLKLLRAVPRGRPLLKDDVEEQNKDFADLLPKGTRAITMDVDEINSLANMVKPGNYVDLFLITTDPANPMNGQQIVPVLQRVKVLATGEQSGRRALEEETGPRGAQARRYSNITFEVTPEQAARIALAQQLGKVRAVLRNSEDTGAPHRLHHYRENAGAGRNAQARLHDRTERGFHHRRQIPNRGRPHGAHHQRVGTQYTDDDGHQRRGQ